MQWFTAFYILANGRSGRETTLWTGQKDFFYNKIVILYIQTNRNQWLGKFFVQNTADKAENASRCNVEGNYAHP